MILKRLWKPRIFMRHRILTRLRTVIGRETSHLQIKAHRLSHGKPFQLSKEHYFIAVAALEKTVVMPEAVLALEQGKRRMLVVMPVKGTAGAFLCVRS
jgi:hypothetical protein